MDEHDSTGKNTVVLFCRFTRHNERQNMMDNPFQSPLETDSATVANAQWWPTARWLIGAHLVCAAIAVALIYLDTQGIQLPSAVEFVATSFVPVATFSLFVCPALMLFVLYRSTANFTEWGTIILLEFVAVATHCLALFPLVQ